MQQLNRRLREEQDAEYQRSLLADQEREKQRAAERAAKEEQQQAAQQAQDAARWVCCRCTRSSVNSRWCLCSMSVHKIYLGTERPHKGWP